MKKSLIFMDKTVNMTALRTPIQALAVLTTGRWVILAHQAKMFMLWLDLAPEFG